MEEYVVEFTPKNRPKLIHEATGFDDCNDKETIDGLEEVVSAVRRFYHDKNIKYVF